MLTSDAGPSSNVAFLRYIARGIASKSNSSQPWSPSFPGLNQASDHGFASISRSGFPSPTDKRETTHIDLFALPSPEDTTRLINAFFVDTATLFPYIHRESFLSAYSAVGDNNWTQVRRTWLALLNMVLALATSAVVDSRVAAPNRMAESKVFYRRAVDLCRERMMRGATLEIGTDILWPFRGSDIDFALTSTMLSAYGSVLTRDTRFCCCMGCAWHCSQGCICTGAALQPRTG